MSHPAQLTSSMCPAPLGVLLTLVGIAAFSGKGVLAQFAYDHVVEPLTLMKLRMATVALPSWLLLLGLPRTTGSWSRHPLLRHHNHELSIYPTHTLSTKPPIVYSHAVALGVCVTVLPVILILEGMCRIAIDTSGLLNLAGVLLAFLLVWTLFGKHLSLLQWLGFAIVIAGAGY